MNNIKMDKVDMKEIDKLHKRFIKYCLIMSIILGTLMCINFYLEYKENFNLRTVYVDEGTC